MGAIREPGQAILNETARQFLGSCADQLGLTQALSIRMLHRHNQGVIHQ